MARRSQRNNKRRGPVTNDTARPSNGQPTQATPAGGDRYQKFLPEWMKGPNAPIRPARPPRPRGARPKRAAGGYTPGKAALGDVAFRDM